MHLLCVMLQNPSIRMQAAKNTKWYHLTPEKKDLILLATFLVNCFGQAIPYPPPFFSLK